MTSPHASTLNLVPSRERLDIRTAPGQLPTAVLPTVDDAPGWARHHRDALRQALDDLGCILVRGLDLADPDHVGQVFQELATEWIAEREPFATRSQYSPGVYSSTPWPAAQPMCMHHELSYLREVPGLMLFACLEAASSGGATALSDAHEVLTALPPALVERFDKTGWTLIRNYNNDIGAPLAQSFGTEERSGVEAYCRANGIEYEWRPDGGLRTKQRRPAIVRHPRTGHRCWFNQIAFLSEWAMDPEIREYLIEVSGEDGLPFARRTATENRSGPRSSNC